MLNSFDFVFKVCKSCIWFIQSKMDYFNNPSHLKLLQNLLKEPEDNSSDSESDDRVPQTSTKFATTSTSGLQNEKEGTKVNEKSNSKSSDDPISSNQSASVSMLRKSPPQTLAEWEEQEAKFNENAFEDRLTPEYRIIYKQSIAPEDIYLQMSSRTTATASCEEMCLEILMPQETVSIDRMQLDVTADEIDLRTPVYRLKLPLVQQIDPDHGKASWDNKEKTLRLTVRMKREYDFINF